MLLNACSGLSASYEDSTSGQFNSIARVIDSPTQSSRSFAQRSLGPGLRLLLVMTLLVSETRQLRWF